MRSLVRGILMTLVLLLVALVSALTAMRLAIHGREVPVPNVIGKTPAEASNLLDKSGLRVEVEREYYSANVPEGKILSQVPDAGTQVRRGWQIRVARSLGPQRVEIPNVLGQSERAAEINILRRGLELAAITRVPIAGTPPEQVMGQIPAPNAVGVSAPKISLLLAEADLPQAFVMPRLVGQPLGTVQMMLKDAGLTVGTLSIAGESSPSGM